MRPIYAIDAWTLAAVYYFAEGYPWWWWGALALANVFLMLLLADTRKKP